MRTIVDCLHAYRVQLMYLLIEALRQPTKHARTVYNLQVLILKFTNITMYHAQIKPDEVCEYSWTI